MSDVTITLTREEAQAELDSRPVPSNGHEVDCHDETAYHPSGDQYTVCRAFCTVCDWSRRGDPDDTRDEAAGHERETAPPDVVADKLRAALKG